eukprot:GHVR01087015.1.p1 GENE.GHVR01087015.1~~GHVR01087015.1.p1  ORF type:complete len:161 (+),score=31.27 GHVR01087015.1:74-556(+)
MSDSEILQNLCETYSGIPVNDVRDVYINRAMCDYDEALKILESLESKRNTPQSLDNLSALQNIFSGVCGIKDIDLNSIHMEQDGLLPDFLSDLIDCAPTDPNITSINPPRVTMGVIQSSLSSHTGNHQSSPIRRDVNTPLNKKNKKIKKIIIQQIINFPI